MIWWIILGTYVLGYVATWRTTVWFLIMDVCGSPSRVDGDDLAFGFFLGSIINLFWPPVLLGKLIRAIYRAQDEEAVMRVLMPRSAQREYELRARERNIERLERELGIVR